MKKPKVEFSEKRWSCPQCNYSVEPEMFCTERKHFYYGDDDAAILNDCSIPGQFVRLRYSPAISSTHRGTAAE